MKKIYLIALVLLCCSGMASAQIDYTPLVREGVRWVYLFSDVTNYGESEDFGKGDYAYFMEFRGDTIINGLTYKKLYSSFTRTFDETKIRPVAYLREADKHVYGISDPEGRFQYVESHNLELPMRGMAMYGASGSWQEYELYDFNDMETFAHKVLWWGDELSMTKTVVTVNGEPRNAYKFDGDYDTFTIVEGIGNEDGNLLSFGSNDYPTCVCPVPLGLAQQETLNGNIIYRGNYFYGPYQGNWKIDIETVNHVINIILGYCIYSRFYNGDIDDFNGDYKVDVEDVNAVINYILAN